MKFNKPAFRNVKLKVVELFAPEAQYGARPVVISGFKIGPSRLWFLRPGFTILSSSWA